MASKLSVFLAESGGRKVGRIAVVCVLAFLASADQGLSQSNTLSGFAIENITVIDVIEGRLRPGMTVVVQGSRISFVGPAAEGLPSGSVQRVDGSGQYLIPGLWDMHVHIMAFPWYLVNGVTGIVNMHGNREQAGELRLAIEAGELDGPRLIVAGHVINGPLPETPVGKKAATPQDGRRLVDSLEAAGVEFIKVLSLLEADVYRAIIDQAGKLGLPVAGHVPFAVPVGEASDLGQKRMEHLSGVVEGCSAADADVRATRAAWRTERTSRDLFFDPELYRQILAGFDPELCKGLLEKLAANRTWQVPTLVANRSVAFAHDSSFTADPNLVYVGEWTRNRWEDFSAAVRSNRSRQEDCAFYELQLKVAGLAAESGVPLLAGTDTWIPYVFAGFSLHDELELLVEAGLNPHQALRSATYNPAVFLEATDSLGTIEVGKLADLVLLDANPLEDISNTQNIVAVVANGRFYDRAFLDELLAQMKREAAGGPPPPMG